MDPLSTTHRDSGARTGRPFLGNIPPGSVGQTLLPRIRRAYLLPHPHPPPVAFLNLPLVRRVWPFVLVFLGRPSRTDTIFPVLIIRDRSSEIPAEKGRSSPPPVIWIAGTTGIDGPWRRPYPNPALASARSGPSKGAVDMIEPDGKRNHSEHSANRIALVNAEACQTNRTPTPDLRVGSAPVVPST